LDTLRRVPVGRSTRLINKRVKPEGGEIKGNTKYKGEMKNSWEKGSLTDRTPAKRGQKKRGMDWEYMENRGPKKRGKEARASKPLQKKRVTLKQEVACPP